MNKQQYLTGAIGFMFLTLFALVFPPITRYYDFIGGICNTVAIIFFYKLVSQSSSKEKK